MHPTGGIRFEIAENGRQRSVRPQLNKNVHMVGNTVYREQNAALSANDSADIFVKSFLIFIRDQRFAILRREHNMIDEIRV